VDAAQALARMPLRVGAFDDPAHLDFVAGAGHKAYAPFGAGFLYGPRALMDGAPPYLPGGGTATRVTARDAEFMPAPDRHQGGTPNIAGVVAMARALQFLQSLGMSEVREHEVRLVERVLRGMEEMGGVTVYGPSEARARLGVVSFNVDGVADLLTAAVLSEEGAIAVRNGRFCSHLYVDRLLSAQRGEGGSGAEVTGAVRASVGLYNDASDVDRLLEFVRRVRDHKWVGHYRIKGDAVSAEFAGRCADRWMEAAHHDPEALSVDAGASLGYDFEVLQPEGFCRSYLIADPATGEAAIVDPLRQKVDDYLDLLKARRYRLLYTVETHTHADHLSGSARLKELTGAQMLMHADSPAPCVDRPLRDGDMVSLGKVRIEVIATPGHTSDAVSLLLPGRVLTGDSLLIGGCGRTDLPTGDSSAMFESLRRLSALPDETLVLPCHDYEGRRASTIGREKKLNARFQTPSVEKFVASQREIELPKPLGLDEMLDTNRRCL
jgi:glyoxylase-like metal-dependent hydrolase (beta-lactamase superfamily II)